MARYRLLSKLAKGGMAEVLLAEAIGRDGFRKKLVIKRILQHLSEDETFVEMFLQEARLAAQLTHPNIIQIFDLGHFGDQPFISMEYVDGRNLREVLRLAAKQGKRLPVDVIVKIVAHACEALAYAHSLEGEAGPLKLIHRDVSPENIMISRNGVVKLVDFGIAKASTSVRQTEIGTVRGKANYLAPEQVLGLPLDGRADLFAVSVVLYEALSGGPKPFRKTGPHELMRAIAYEPHLPLRDSQPDLPQVLVDIVDRGLAKSRDDRWQSCGVLAGELERFLVQKGSYVPASAIAEAIAQVCEDAPEAPQPSGTLPVEEVDAEIVWTESHSTPAAATLEEPAPSPAGAAAGEELPSIELSGSMVVEPVKELTENSRALLHRGGNWFSDAPPVNDPSNVVLSIEALSPPSVVVEPEPEPEPVSPPMSGVEAASLPVLDLEEGPPAGSRPDGAARRRKMVVTAVAVGALLAVGGGLWAMLPGAASKDEATVHSPVLLTAQPPAPEAATGSDAAPLEVLVFPAGRADEPGRGTEVEADGSAPAGEQPAVPAPSPAPLALPAATTGSLRVEANVGAEVLLDGTRVGTTPLSLEELAPGRHSIEVRNEALGTSRSGSVEIKAGETAAYRARFGRGRLVIRAKPFARVFVDGKAYGVTPLKPISLTEGRHRVELVYDGGAKPQSRVHKISVVARREKRITEIFEE